MYRIFSFTLLQRVGMVENVKNFGFRGPLCHNDYTQDYLIKVSRVVCDWFYLGITRNQRARPETLS